MPVALPVARDEVPLTGVIDAEAVGSDPVAGGAPSITTPPSMVPKL